jgi:predicted dinucleotide-binding enzyme
MVFARITPFGFHLRDRGHRLRFPLIVFVHPILTWELVMKIGILGSGGVAKTLATGFLKHGHTVTLGTRDTTKLADWILDHPAGRVGSFADAASYGDVVVLAVKGTAGAEALRQIDAVHLDGKAIIDTTNPITAAPPEGGVLKYFTTLEDSLMERLQKEFPAAHFVKAFNSVGAAFMVDPSFKGGKPTMFICGNDVGAKETTTGILDQFGWDVVDMGGVEAARAIEPLCMLWCIPGFLRNEWGHAFKLLR